MSGQWMPDQTQPAPEKPQVKLLTEQQVMEAHRSTQDFRFATVDAYLREFTKKLNIELQKEE